MNEDKLIDLENIPQEQIRTISTIMESKIPNMKKIFFTIKYPKSLMNNSKGGC